MSHGDSVADPPRLPMPPDEAPNVLIVLLDDVGYGVTSTFGGLVAMPTLDRLAAGGLRYCQFHSAGLSSPTRAALLTGRDHHTAASGVDEETATGYPGYHGAIPKSCASIAELLRQNGYATGWWGKNHNVPEHEASAAGPFDNWPAGLGFDYFYGFIGAESNQFDPLLYRNTTPVDRPRDAPSYHLTTDLTDDCIAWIRRQKAIAPNRPFFAFYAPGCGHAPHQPPLEWRGRHAGRFSFGWDEYRLRVFERQLSLHVVPPDTRLTDRPSSVREWTSLSADEQSLFARFFENYADHLAHGDQQIGRLVDTLGEMNELENTLLIYIAGDAGSSDEGTPTGTLNDIYALNGYGDTLDRLLPRSSEIGLPGTSPHYPAGWAWAGNVPFKGAKSVASHFGATRNGLVIHWPKRIHDAGGVRFQFHHVVDIVPTILEVIGIAAPSTVNGALQRTMAGVSMAYTFAEQNAATASRRNLQYFELFGHRALYHDGWIACCRHDVGSFRNERWELYRIGDDFSQFNDLAADEPGLLRELQDLFIVETARHDVLPLDDRRVERLDVAMRPGWFSGRARVTLPPDITRLPEGCAPATIGVDHTIAVAVELSDDGAEGVLVCLGGDTGGWVLCVRDRRLVYHYNFFDVARYEIVSESEVPAGRVELKVSVRPDTSLAGSAASVQLFVDGDVVGEGRIERSVPARFGFECLDIGVDNGTPVAEWYRTRRGFPFTGKIERVTFEFG